MYKERTPNVTYKGETLCWDCQKNTGSCPWSSSFTPVEGWRAIPTKINTYQKFNEGIDSYLVLECPQFKKRRKRRW